MAYNWEKIFKNKTDKELIEIWLEKRMSEIIREL